MYQKFPTGHYAERAAWKIGWWAYRNGNYAETVRVFEGAAANFPRSDYRPPWLYWSARAHEALREPALAEARFALVETDYRNSYYGRLASKRLDTAGRAAPPADQTSRMPHSEFRIQKSAPIALPPNETVVRTLLSLDLYDQALDELHYAQKVWGDSPAIQATIGWIYYRRGELRAGINVMKRAYPQYMAAGGEKLPRELLKVLFPINYWPLIKRYSNEHQLDPYVVAALIAQESTFTADVKSAANAYGLMQLLPSTGRQYARMLHLPRFSVGMLTTAEANIKMGTAYFADLVKQFGGLHFALATYNAGPSRIAKWIAAKPGLERDEFIDDIPFPETQNYVKRILGTAEDYRRLYGPDGAADADRRDSRGGASAGGRAAAAAGEGVGVEDRPAKKKQPREEESGLAQDEGHRGHRGRTGPCVSSCPVLERSMSKLTGSKKATQFTESVIREMTRLNQLLRRRQPVAGVSGLSGAAGDQGRGLRGDQRRRQPVRGHLGRAAAARGDRARVHAGATAWRSSPTSR